MATEATEISISQNEVLNVNLDRKNYNIMKITKIEDITDSLLKEATASSVVEFIAEEIKKANEAFIADKTEKENELKAANEKIVSVTTEHEAVKKQVQELSEKLSSLEAEKEVKAKEEAFNIRMTALDEEFDLDEEDRKVIASDIKDLNEETFSAYKEKMSVLMKEKKKSYKKAMAEKMQKEMAVKAEEIVASEKSAEPTTQEVVDQAVDNGAKASTEIPNSAPAAQPSIKEKYAAAFGLDGFELNK